MVGLRRQMVINDFVRSGSLVLQDFLTCFDDLKVANLCESEMKMLFQCCDTTNSGKIRTLEFFDDFVGLLNPTRAKLVEDTYKKLDASSDYQLSLDDVKQRYDPRQHPDVLAKF